MIPLGWDSNDGCFLCHIKEYSFSIEFAVILKIKLFTIEKLDIVIIRVSNLSSRRTAPLFVPIILVPRHFVPMAQDYLKF